MPILLERKKRKINYINVHERPKLGHWDSILHLVEQKITMVGKTLWTKKVAKHQYAKMM